MPVQHEPDDTPRQEITLLAIPAALVLLWSSGFIAAFVGLLGITFGTICQKKFCAEMDPRTAYAIQFLMATILIAPLAMIFEEGHIHWTPAFFGALAIWPFFSR